MSGSFSVGPFELELITLTHSIPEPNAVVLRTPFGTVLHTGDWKFDPDPLVGAPPTWRRSQRLGDEGVLAMVCDSTNALRPGEVGLRSRGAHGAHRARRAAAATASRSPALPRTSRGSQSAAAAAAAHDRHVALVGRSLWRIEHAARETGYLKDVPPFLTEEEAAYLPRDKVLLICTGSQGEPRAALWRIAEDEHPDIVLEPGDTVDLLLARHSRQRARHRPLAERARRARRRDHHRARSFRPCLGPSGAGRARRACTAPVRPRSRCRCMARRAI